jgi:hypothetical protein
MAPAPKMAMRLMGGMSTYSPVEKTYLFSDWLKENLQLW